MIFPKDINKRIADKSKIAGDNKVQLAFTLFFLGNFFGFFVAGWINRMLFGGGFWTTVLILVVLNLIVGVFVFRYLIFDEDAKVQEYKNAENDSFSKYVKIRKDVEHVLKTPEGKVNATEYANGSVAFTVELKFGSNDNRLAESTRAVLQDLMHAAHRANFETRVCIAPENFGRSQEYEDYTRQVNAVESQKLRNALIRMSEAIMTEHRRRGNASSIYITVHSLSNYQRAELEGVLKEFLKIFDENVTAFRSIRFLNQEDLIQFFIDFYGVSAIDLATARAVDLAKSIDEDFRNIVKLVSLQATDGSKFVGNGSDNDKAFRLKEKLVE